MRLTRLLPDVKEYELSDGWDRPRPYQPRHGKPPMTLRTALSAAAILGNVSERYLGAGDTIAAASTARTARPSDVVS